MSSDKSANCDGWNIEGALGRRDAFIKPAQVVQQLYHGTEEPAGMRPNPGVRQGEAVWRMKAPCGESIRRYGITVIW